MHVAQAQLRNMQQWSDGIRWNKNVFYSTESNATEANWRDRFTAYHNFRKTSKQDQMQEHCQLPTGTVVIILEAEDMMQLEAVPVAYSIFIWTSGFRQLASDRMTSVMLLISPAYRLHWRRFQKMWGTSFWKMRRTLQVPLTMSPEVMFWHADHIDDDAACHRLSIERNPLCKDMESVMYSQDQSTYWRRVLWSGSRSS